MAGAGREGGEPPSRAARRAHARQWRRAWGDVLSWAVFWLVLAAAATAMAMALERWIPVWILASLLLPGLRPVAVRLARAWRHHQPWRFPVAPLRAPGERTVRLTSWGAHRQRVLVSVYIEATSGLTWSELAERKDAKSPLVVREGLSDDAAMRLGLLLEGHGATVVID